MEENFGAKGYVPNFAYNSKEEVRAALLAGGKAASYIHLTNRFVAGDPEMERLVKAHKASNAARDQEQADQVASRAAAKAAAPKLDVLFLKNLDSPDLSQESVRGFGFKSSEIPDSRVKFEKSFASHWPNMVNAVASDMLKGKKYEGQELSSKFQNKTLSENARKTVEGTLFEAMLKGMSDRMVGKGQETGVEAVDLDEWKIRPEFKGLFTDDMPDTGVEVRRDNIKGVKAREKMEERLRGRRFAGHIPNFIYPTSSRFVPNFYGEELKKAKRREVNGLMDRGYTFSEAQKNIYVGRHSSITANDQNLGIFNRIDEPRGPQQGINRALSEGKSVNSYGTGASKGYLPNFIDDDDDDKGFIGKFFGSLEKKLHSNKGGAGHLGAAVERLPGVGLMGKAMKGLNSEAKQLAKILREADKSSEEYHGALAQLAIVEKERIDILGEEANAANAANREGTGTSVSASGIGAGKGLGGMEVGRKERAAEDASSDLLQKTFFLSSSLGVVEQLVPELQGVTSTASSMANTFSSVASILPGTAGKVVGGLAAAAVGAEGIKTAIWDVVNDVKGIG